MKTLWAPWRMEHIEKRLPQPDGCLFEPEGDSPFDRDVLLLYRDSRTVVILNRFPYTNGHLLVAPLRHIDCLTKLENDEQTALMAILVRAADIVKNELQPDGLNVGCNLGKVAGAGIDDHLHFHIVPRWKDDHNFMTVLAEVRSIPEHLMTTFDRLLPPFQKLFAENNRD